MKNTSSAHSKVNWLKPLALSVALFCLGSVTWWLEFKHRPEKEDQEENSKKVFGLKDMPVSSIRLVKSGKATVFRCMDLDSKLCKPGDQSKWEITEPTQIKADETNVNALLSSLNYLAPSETIDLSTETPEKKEKLLKQYGISDQNRIEIASNSLKDKIVTLQFGEMHPIGDAMFAQSSNQKGKIILIPGYVKANFDKDMTWWRDKKLLALSTHQVLELQSSGPKGKYTAAKKENQWTVDGLAGDLENIDGLITAISYLQAKSFVSESKADPRAKLALMGATPSLNLKLTREVVQTEAEKTPSEKKSEQLTIQFYEKKIGPKNKLPLLYAALSNATPLFELDYSSLDRVNRSAQDLRMTKLVTSVDRFTTKKITLEGKDLGKVPLVVSHDGSKWILEAGKAEADAEKVQIFLDRLTNSKIKGFLAGSQVPSGQNLGLTVALTDDKGALKRKFVLWKSGEKIYSKDLLSSRNEAFLMDDFLKDNLPTGQDYFAMKAVKK